MKQSNKKEQTSDETNKICKKMKCSGSLCSNTKVMQKPDQISHDHRRGGSHAALMASSSETSTDASTRSMKTTITLSDLNNGAHHAVSNSSLSLSSSSSSSFFTVPASPSISGSFRSMPFRKLSGCYECRMVVDPVLGMTRDPSLRATICSCPQCGEVFMKPENLELHQAVRHAGN